MEEYTPEEPYERPYKSSLWRITRWLLVALVLTVIAAFFKPINIWMHRGVTYAKVTSIFETYNMDNLNAVYPAGKTYMVEYEFTVDGKTYTGKSEMKSFIPLNTNSPWNAKGGPISTSDVADIEIVYCKHWPAWFYIKNSRVEWSYRKY